MRRADKDPVSREDVPRILEGVVDLYATRGKRILHWELPDGRGPSDALDAVVGRSGNLRAPVLRFASTMVVGFDGDLLSRLLS